MQQNHAIAVIIIVLFVVLTALSYGIYCLIQAGRASNGTTTTGSESIVDDDDSSVAPLVVPPFVPPPVVPPVIVPQRVPPQRAMPQIVQMKRPPPQRVMPARPRMHRVPRVPPPPQQIVEVQIQPPRDGSVSPMEADPFAPRPGPGPPPPPPVIEIPLMPGEMPEGAQPAWGLPPELHGGLPAELEANAPRRRTPSPSGTLRRHAKQRARPTLMGWLGGQMPAARVVTAVLPLNPRKWDIPAW